MISIPTAHPAIDVVRQRGQLVGRIRDLTRRIRELRAAADILEAERSAAERRLDRLHRGEL